MRGIDRYIPHSDFRERHLRHVRAPADGVLAAADAYRPEDRFFRRMIGVREWPMRVERALRRRQGPVPAPFGMGSFALLERGGREVVHALAGRFWHPRLSPDSH